MIKYIVPVLLLVTALALSSVSAYYSILGLLMIFSTGAYGFIFMECAKVATTLFLHKHWEHNLGILKVWLTVSVIVLAMITSMGVFGYLSKASTKNSESVSVNSSKVVYLEDSISRENAKLQRNLSQIDTYNESISRLITDNPLKASNERRRLQKQITEINKENAIISTNIDTLSKELLPYKSEVKKHEVEIGPLLYITKLIYGQEYKNHSDRTLTYLILIIVLVFDPLAISLLIASQKGFELIKDVPKQEQLETSVVEMEQPDIEPTQPQEIPFEIVPIDPYEVKRQRMASGKSQM